MRRVSGVVALFVVVALAGCAGPMTVAYKGALSQEETSAAAAIQATATPLAVKSSAKGETIIAVSSSGGGSGSGGTSVSSGSGSGGVRATGSASPSHPTSSGSVTITVKVITTDGKPVSGAKVTITCQYQSLVLGGGSDSSTFSMTTNSSGTCSKSRDATPFNGPTMVGVSGTVLVNGSTHRILCPGYSINFN